MIGRDASRTSERRETDPHAILATALPGIGVLVTGDVYYVKKREVRAFGKAHRIVAGLISLIWSAAMLNALVGGRTG